MDVEGDQKQPLIDSRDGSGGRVHFRQMPPRLDPSEPYQGIGTDLQAARRQRGLSVPQVAQALRIQASHIEALETGRISALPGATYAIGFLRSYADFVGFDAEAAVARFKEEEAIRADPTRLVFPEPLGAARRPGWRLALVSLAALAVAYGGWVYLQRQGLPSFETVSEPPERMTAMLTTPPAGSEDTAVLAPLADAGRDDGGAPEPVTTVTPRPDEADSRTTEAASEATEPTSPRSAGRAVVPQVTHVEPTRVEVPSRETASVPAPSGPSPAGSREGEQVAEADASALAGGATSTPAPRSQGQLSPAVVAAPAAEPETTAPTAAADDKPTAAPSATAVRDDASEAAEAAPAVPATTALAESEPTPAEAEAAPAAPPAAAPVVRSALQTARRDAGPPQPPTPAPSTSGRAGGQVQGYRPQAFGAVNEDTRVVIRARHDSWVQVQGPNNELLLTRILRAGDVYHAPDRADLVLMTGNAGAIEVIVDGQSLGPLGPEGEIRRGIALDAEGLRDVLRRGGP